MARLADVVMTCPRLGPAASAVLLALLTQIAPGAAQAPRQSEPGHPRIANPATLTGERAEAVYQAIRENMRLGYAGSGETEMLAYQTWRRFNRFPYRSQAHGERFVNHYANDRGAGYGDFEDLRPLPHGAIIVKDSFTVTKDGVLLAGPLFAMEKMRAGFRSTAGRWRFWMLRPDGSMVGLTGGPDAAKVEFCAVCHKSAGPEQDFLHLMPGEIRIRK